LEIATASVEKKWTFAKQRSDARDKVGPALDGRRITEEILTIHDVCRVSSLGTASKVRMAAKKDR
jgi:hypothetical protein